MNPINQPTESRLDDAIYALSMAKDVPDADVLEAVIKDYPELANELTEYAIDMVVDAMIGDDDAAGVSDADTSESEAVSLAISRFHNRLFKRKTEEAQSKEGVRKRTAQTPNPFQDLERRQYRALIEKLEANATFVNKLRDRQIDGDTMTPGFKQRVAQDLEVPIEVVLAHFAAAAGSGARQHYKSDGKPDANQVESFEQAVRNSELTPGQQRALLAL